MKENTKIILVGLIGIILGVGLVFGTRILFNIPAQYHEEKFVIVPKTNSQRISVDAAIKGLKNYRNPNALKLLYENWDGKVFGIAHEKKEYDSLYHLAFERFIDSHSTEPGYEWQLGLYFNVVDNTTDGTNPKLNIYFVPIMVSASGPVLDFYELYKEAGNKDPYSKYYNGNKAWTDGEEYIFDQGTLFP